MDLELKGSPKLRVVYEGKDYMLSKPTLGDALKLESDLKSFESSGGQNAVIVDFIAARGLPKDVLLTFEVEMLEQVVQALLPSKKKS